jgi:hypothetical protein
MFVNVLDRLMRQLLTVTPDMPSARIPMQSSRKSQNASSAVAAGVDVSPG